MSPITFIVARRKRAPGLWAATLTAALLALAAAAPAAACNVCYGSQDNGSPMVTGARVGVFLLLGFTVVMLGGFAAFFLYLRHRARQAEAGDLAAQWAQLPRSAAS